MPLSRKNPRRKKNWKEQLNRMVRQGRKPVPTIRQRAHGRWDIPEWVSTVTEKLFGLKV